MKKNREFQEVMSLTKGILKSSAQINSAFESDCEIIKIKSGYLATSTDSIGEEIDLKIYQHPKLWGWMTVMNSISDLSAAAVQPLGILISNQWKYGTPKKTKELFFKGVKEALAFSQVPLLGGDSGNGEAHCHTSTILGTSKSTPLTRLGIKKGDVLCLLGKKQAGNGPALALRILFNKPPKSFPEKYFKPKPSLQKMIRLRPFISASIDTSDGIATALQTLSQLNKVGFKMIWNEFTLTPESLKFCEKNKIHPRLLWMSDLGDLQTLVAIPEKNLVRALELDPELMPIARAVPSKNGITIQYENKKFRLPVEKVTDCLRDLRSLRRVMAELNRWFFNLD